MSDQITNKILESYGFKGALPQFKSIVYPIEILKHNIEDHQLKQISPELQQILQSEQAREMVEKRGITLEKTKEFFRDKIKEYNAIIDLQHLRFGQSYSTPKKDSTFKRHTADQGQITNYHLVLNWQNLNLVFDEIDGSKQTTKPAIQTSFQSQFKQQSSKATTTKSQQKQEGLVSRLDQKFSDFDSKFAQSITTQLPESRRFSSIEGTPLLKINRKRSLNTATARKQVQINSFLKTLQVLRSPAMSTEDVELQNRKQMIKKYINESFQKPRKDTEEDSQRERAKSQQQHKRMNERMQKELNEIKQTVSFDVKDNLIQNQDIPLYDNICNVENQLELQIVDCEKIKQQNERRRNVIQSFNERKQPKYVHLGGSRYAVKNNFTNQQNYQNTINKLLEQQLQDEMKKLKPSDDYIDLEILEGPPKKMDYHTSNMNQDYNDIKVNKILQKMRR